MRKKIFRRTFLSHSFFLISFYSFAQKPIITSIAPTSAPIGANVTITGANFGNSPIVYFGPVKADIINSSPTSINVIVPVGAESQTITVTSNNLISYPNTSFSVQRPCTGLISANSFNSKIDISLGQVISNTLIADFDGDGKVDILACILGQGIVAFRNTTVGAIISFEKVTITTKGNYYLAMGDLDGDGKIDIVGNDVINNKVQSYFFVFRNKSVKGKIEFEVMGGYLNIGYTIDKIFVKDMDADGKLDVVTSSKINPGYSIFKNTSPQLYFPIVFSKPVIYPLNEYGNDKVRHFDISVEDLNMDGKPDITIAAGIGELYDGAQYIYITQNFSKEGNLNLIYMNRIRLPYQNIYSDRKILVGNIDNAVMPGIAFVYSIYSKQKSSSFIYSYRNITFMPGGLINLKYSSAIEFTDAQTSYMMADIDGDNMGDIIGFGNDLYPSLAKELIINRNTTAPNKAISWTNPNSYVYLTNLFSQTTNPVTPLAIADFDGNGIVDVIANYFNVDNQQYSIATIRRKTGFCNSSQQEQITSPIFTTQNAINLRTFQQGNSWNIDFIIPYATKIKIDLYDIAGRKMESLYNNFVEKGKEYKFSYNVSHLSKGMYLYKITTDKEIFSKQVVVAK